MEHFKNLKTKYKLLIMNGIIISSLIAIFFTTFSLINTEINKLINKDLKSTSLIINNTLNFLYKENIKYETNEDLKELVKHIKIGKTGYVYLLSLNGIFLVHPTKSGENYSKAKYVQQILNSNKKEGFLDYTSEATGQKKRVFYTYNKNLNLYTVPGINVSEYKNQIISKFYNYFLLITLISILILGSIVWLISKSITTGLEKINNNIFEFFKYVNNEIEDISLETITSKDEFGLISEEIKNNISVYIEEKSKNENNLENINEINSNLNYINQSLNNSYNQIQILLKSFHSIQSLSILNERKINEAEDNILKMNESSEEIQNNIEDIEKIAFQTNILSLNAAVEAAVAGESGKSFSVVAAEVRELAQISSKLAKDMKKISDNNFQSAEEIKKIMLDIKKDFSDLKNTVSSDVETLTNMSEQLGMDNERMNEMNHTMSTLKQ